MSAPGITTAPVEEYMYRILPARGEVLADMERQAKERDIPIVGPAVGRLFYQLAAISGARRVFELGSAIGYSTIWWAMAVGEGGRVIYTDSSEGSAKEARRYVEKAGLADRVEFCVGDALQALRDHPGPFDIIFNDVDKTFYPQVLPLVAPKLRKGGLFLTDNVLWSGRVTAPAAEQDENTRAISEFNRKLYEAPEFFTTVMPLRDGVAIASRI